MVLAVVPQAHVKACEQASQLEPGVLERSYGGQQVATGGAAKAEERRLLGESGLPGLLLLLERQIPRCCSAGQMRWPLNSAHNQPSAHANTHRAHSYINTFIGGRGRERHTCRGDSMHGKVYGTARTAVVTVSDRQYR